MLLLIMVLSLKHLSETIFDDTVDKTFGIRFKNGKFVIGNKIIKIQDDNIVIDNEVYVGTPDLWTLITEKNPKEYDEQDYERYKELIYKTNVLCRDYDPRSSYPRANRSTKWKTIFLSVWEDFQHKGIAPINYEADDEDEYYSASGDGLSPIYLPKNSRCFSIHRVGYGIHLTPRPLLAGIRGDGLYLHMGSGIYNGNGLLLGPRSPFRNIPILKWIL